MNKYGPKAQSEITKTMKAFNDGSLHLGSSDKKVRSRDQAIAIGISKARKKGYKVPKHS